MIDPACIFCKIAAGQIPSASILEDEHALAFMDVGPLAEGHLLLIPRRHYVTLDQMPSEEAAGLLRHLPVLCRALKHATACEGINVLQNNGRVAHQVVQHVHFHLIPRKSGDAFHFNWPAGKYPAGRMEQLAAALVAALKE